MVRALSAFLLPALLTLTLLAGVAAAQDVFQEGTMITVELMNGDKLTGLLLDAQGPKLVIQHDVFGRMEIPRAALKPPTPPEAKPVEAVTPWSGKFDLALSGSEGNTDTQNFRTELDVKHDNEEVLDVFTFWYQRSETDNQATAAKSFTQARREWKLAEHKWRPFVQGSLQTDQFSTYDQMATVAGGVAYPCIDTETNKLTGRLGAGITHKYGESDPSVNETSYDALIGLDWLYTINAISNFSFTTDMYPSVSEGGEFRSVSRAAYERKVDPDSAWFVKLGVDHFYDSTAGTGVDSTDWNYYLGLGRAF
jgi:hypothetical protein